MASYNRVFLIGHAGRGAERRTTEKGTALATFTMATNERWTDGEGEAHERTEWHRVVAWGKTADIVGEYVKKGSQVFVEGALQTREWEDKEGNKRMTGEIRAQRIVLLGRKPAPESPTPPTTDEDIPF